MPDNALLFYSIADTEKNRQTLLVSDKKLLRIKEQIDARKKGEIKGAAIGRIGRHVYHLCTRTSKFYADNSCVGCGLCAKNCPDNAIEMKDSKPRWVKDRCTKCTACINRCPSKAIQYGKATVKRNRYVNPVFKGSR